MIGSIIKLNDLLNQYRKGSIKFNKNAKSVDFQKPIWTNDQDKQKLIRIDKLMETLNDDYDYYTVQDTSPFDREKTWTKE